MPIVLNKGSYKISFRAAVVGVGDSGTESWCSCSEANQGFTMSRFISMWEYTKDSEKIKQSQQIREQLPILTAHSDILHFMKTSLMLIPLPIVSGSVSYRRLYENY